ncbi:MAG: F0F1 ATP synthase subunit gamma [Betaproteobacteria bacterium]|nr:F0F1 ATP synthase subunit gamma [Betaproteobacteria bacterium]
MSKRRDLERHLHSLDEIREIMNAMRNLALMETQKLTRRLAAQHRVVASIRNAADDLLSFHPHLPRTSEAAHDVYLLMGSERGFCGDFNDTLLRAAHARTDSGTDPVIITIGGKLGMRWPDDPRVVARLEGPSVLEEVEIVLLKMMEALDRWRAAQLPARAFRLTVFHHGADAPGVAVTQLDPFSQRPPQPSRFGYAPLINLEARLLFSRLAEHYLFAALHELFFGSLMAENHQRIQHVDYAVRKIEQDSQALLLKRNSLRQEEITEEIEVIMLSVDAPG